MIIDVFTDAFRYSTRDIKLLFKVGILSFFSVLIIPGFLLAGYSFRIVKVGSQGMINGQDPIPEFNEWKAMFCDGAKLIVLKVIYLIIPSLLLISAHFTFKMKMYPVSLLLSIVGIIGAMVAVLFYYIALPTLTINGNLSEAFKIKDLYGKIQNISINNYVSFYLILVLIELAIQLTAIYILKFIFGVFGIFISFSGGFDFTGGFELYSFITAIFIDALLLFFVLPFCLFIKSRCVGLIYSLSED